MIFGINNSYQYYFNCYFVTKKKYCLFRFTSSISTKISGFFTKKEDDALLKFVEVQKLNNWSVIASKMPNRNENQITKRWDQLMKYA